MTELTVTAEAAPTRATRVTFFEDRAEVTRRATLSVPAGVSWRALAGVTVVVDDSSVVAAVVGDRGRVIAARVIRRERTAHTVDPDARAAAERDLDAAKRRVTSCQLALARARDALRRAESLENTWLAGISMVPRGESGDPRAGAARWRRAFDDAHGAIVRAVDDIALREREHHDAVTEHERAGLRHMLAQRIESRFEAVVEVQLDAPEAASLDVEVSYRTPCALWRPEHVARLSAARDALELRTWAAVWQRTGEDWRDVTARFSTARPARAAAAPPITDDVIALRRKTEYERNRVVVEAREQSIALTGVDRGARDVDEMSGVDDGGEPLWFEAARPATIPSDGLPHRVELHATTVPCTAELVAMPERTEAVHVRATATLQGAHPLLAGPVRVARGTEMVGRGRVGYVGRGDVFELGFGVDDGVRVRRRVDEKREVTTILGTQKILRTVTLHLTNLSDRARTVLATERVPVSEVEDLKVQVVDRGGGTFDARDGFTRWTVTLAPHALETVTLTYRIEASAKVTLTF